MTQAEKETIETFCRELALALRRITGKTIELNPDMLATPVDDNQQSDYAQTPPGECNSTNKP